MELSKERNGLNVDHFHDRKSYAFVHSVSKIAMHLLLMQS